MREVSGGLSALSQTQLFLPRGIKTIRWENLKGGRLKTNERWRCHAKNHNKLSTFSSRYSTDVPLYESPGASFDQYLEDKRRVLKAMFPDGIQINESEKRIEMPPMKFLFLSVRLVVDVKLRCKSVGEDYPFGVPHAITKLLELNITRWEFQGLHRDYQPPHFALGFKGAIYPDRRGRQSRLRNQTEIQISFVASPAFALAPHHLLQSIAESVCKTMMEDMKVRENGRLLADYETFKREKKKKKTKNQDELKMKNS